MEAQWGRDREQDFINTSQPKYRALEQPQGNLNYVTLTGLAPNTKYYYIFGDSTLGASFSAESSFTTPPVPSTSDYIHFIAWADAGQAVAGTTIGRPMLLSRLMN